MRKHYLHRHLHRLLFPHQAVNALAFTSMGEIFAFACDQDVSLVGMRGYIVVYSLPLPQGLEIYSIEFAKDWLTELDFASDAPLLADYSYHNDDQQA